MGTRLNGPVLMGRIVVITGASSGFGRGAALAFAREGAHLVLAARRSDLLNEVVRQCEAAGVNAVAVPTDVSNAADVAGWPRPRAMPSREWMSGSTAPEWRRSVRSRISRSAITTR